MGLHSNSLDSNPGSFTCKLHCFGQVFSLWTLAPFLVKWNDKNIYLDKNKCNYVHEGPSTVAGKIGNHKHGFSSCLESKRPKLCNGLWSPTLSGTPPAHLLSSSLSLCSFCSSRSSPHDMPCIYHTHSYLRAFVLPISSTWDIFPLCIHIAESFTSFMFSFKCCLLLIHPILYSQCSLLFPITRIFQHNNLCLLSLSSPFPGCRFSTNIYLFFLFNYSLHPK